MYILYYNFILFIVIMSKTKVIQTKHNTFVQGIQDDLQEKDLKGVNHLPTPSSTSAQIDYCAKLDWWVDALAEKTITIEKRYNKHEAFLRLCSIYHEWMRSVATDDNMELWKLVSFLWINHIFE